MKALLALLVVLPIGSCSALYLSSEREATLTIEHRERVTAGEQSKYIVFTDAGEYEVTDSLLYFDFRASSRYAALKPGNVCEVTLAGWRVGFLSMYPNIVEVRRCEEPTT